MNFADKLQQAIARNQSLLFLGLDPNLEILPEAYLSDTESDNIVEALYEWLKDLIGITSNLVAAYKPTLGLYTALGVRGMELLHRTLAAIPKDIPIILDAKHGDINTSTILARTIFQDWGVDAVTLSPYSGQDHIAPFLVYPDKAVFILCSTSNPAAVALQGYPTPENPLYLQVVREAKNWGTPEQVGLEVGTTSPEILARVRQLAPERTILARSIWAEGGNLSDILAAGLNDNGEGLLIPIPLDILIADSATEKIDALREEINLSRTKVIDEGSSCSLWIPDVCVLEKHPHLDLILQLYDLGCIMFGSYVQASGETFPYYIDLRKIISHPQVFYKVLNAYAEIIKDLEFDRIAGIPYGSLPTATGLALQMEKPMIFPRKEVKAHGTRRAIEGNFEKGEKVLVVDDILISGKSVMEGAEKIRAAGLEVDDIVVFIDHERGVKDRLKANGFNAYSALNISEITDTLYRAGKISFEQYQDLQTH